MYDLLILFHILLLTYWLGADLGVFYASSFVLRPSLTPQSRSVALRIMSVLDMGPRVCMVLFLPSGASLIAAGPYANGLISGWVLAVIWLFALAWLVLVIANFRGATTRFSASLRQADLLVRVLLAPGLLGAAVYALASAHPFGLTPNPRWLAAKVACYAVAIACGVGIRLQLRPFAPAFAQLTTSGPTPEVERELRQSIGRSKPFVIAIWCLLLAAAALGVFAPGAH